MKYILIATITFFSIISSADNLNNRQRRLSTVYLSQTDIGRSIITQESLKHVYFEKYIFGDLTPALTSIHEIIVHDGNIQHFKINGLLLGASPSYLSWTLAYTLKHYQLYELAINYNFDPNINFLEKEILAFAVAAEHWKQLESPNKEDFIRPIKDKPDDIRNHIDASAMQFDILWNKNNKQYFKQKVEQRFFKINPAGLRARDLLDSDELSESQREYVLDVLKQLYTILNN